MDAADVLGQVRAAAEVLQAQVPAARVRHRLGSGGGGTALTVHHGGGRPAAGHRALHLHQGTADTERDRELQIRQSSDTRGAKNGTGWHNYE